MATSHRARDGKVTCVKDPERQPLQFLQRQQHLANFDHFHYQCWHHRYAYLTQIKAPHQIVAKGFATHILAKDMATLGPKKMLNDEVMNMYNQLLVVETNEPWRRIKYMGTYFHTKLSNLSMTQSNVNLGSGRKGVKMRLKHIKAFLAGVNYKGVCRWTRKWDVFRRQLILVPVHRILHWCLYAIHIIKLKRKPRNKTAPLHKVRIVYYDSHPGIRFCPKTFKQLVAWLQLEYFYKYGRQLKDIEHESGSSTVQTNGYDCGVHVCANAFALCYGVPPYTFTTREHFKEFRVHMALSIERQSIMKKFKYNPSLWLYRKNLQNKSKSSKS